MELQLQPQADVCFVTGAAFQTGDRVVSILVRDATGEYRRVDCLESAERTAVPPGEELCRWTRIFKPRLVGVDAERELKLTAESLFLSLTEDGAEGVEENVPLKQFLALMLERKRILKNRGTSVGGRQVYEHMRTKRLIEVPAGTMDSAFFVNVREKLGVLVGERVTPPAPAPSTAPTQAAAQTQQ